MLADEHFPHLVTKTKTWIF